MNEELIKWLTDSKERTFVLAQAVYEAGPGWICMLRGNNVSIIVYAKTAEDVLKLALEKAFSNNK